MSANHASNPLSHLRALIVTVTLALMALTRGGFELRSHGEGIPGVNLSITLATNNMTLDSTNVLYCSVHNSSTNSVAVNDSGRPEYEFTVMVIDYTGKTLILKPQNEFPGPIAFINRLISLSPGESYQRELHFRLPKAITAGRYTLRARCVVWLRKGGTGVQGNGQQVTSAPIEFQVRRASVSPHY